MLNTLGTSVTKTATWREIPELNATKHDKYHVHDMWTGEDLGEFTNSFSIKIRSHDTAALRLTREDSKFNIFLTVLPQAYRRIELTAIKEPTLIPNGHPL